MKLRKDVDEVVSLISGEKSGIPFINKDLISCLYCGQYLRNSQKANKPMLHHFHIWYAPWSRRLWPYMLESLLTSLTSENDILIHSYLLQGFFATHGACRRGDFGVLTRCHIIVFLPSFVHNIFIPVV